MTRKYPEETPTEIEDMVRRATESEDNEMAQERRFRRFVVSFSVGLILLGLLRGSVSGEVQDRTSRMWAPYLEWSFENPSFVGNPFDVIAGATFRHTASGEVRRTQMFYDGGNRWKLRFTGTRTGKWTFRTSSSDPELDGKMGTVRITANRDAEIKGFIRSFGNKFARQSGENGEFEAYLYNVYQDNFEFPADFWDGKNGRSLDYIRTYPADKWAREYLQAARRNGCNTLFIALGNQWFKTGARSYEEHNSKNPERLTFVMLERVISTVHSMGGHVHIWMWGDESRKWTPVGVGGINGIADRRLQRYIAARLGPLPGWTMSYGFDLEEWVSEDQTGEWAEYLRRHFGWQHLLWARNRSNGKLDAVSHNGKGPNSHEDVVRKMNSDLNRPHLEEERFYYLRWGKYDMTTTRRQLWWYTMAGGMGGHWGRHTKTSTLPYPKPEQLATHRQFWDGRFLLDMFRANNLKDGYSLKTPSNTHYIFYKENTTSVRMNLSEMSGPQPAIAVDTTKDYAEMDLGRLYPTKETWTAPYQSDWAIAVGVFAKRKNRSPSTISSVVRN